MSKRPDLDTNEPPNKRQRVLGRTEICNFCNTPVPEVLFHIDKCVQFKRTFSEYSALTYATAKYGLLLNKVDKCRVTIPQNIETPTARKIVLNEYLSAEREKCRLENRNREAAARLLRIPIICSLPSCSKEQNMSIRGVEPYELPIRTIVIQEKRPLASRYERDAIQIRAMFLDGVPLTTRNKNVRDKRTVPPLIPMTPSTSTNQPLVRETAIPSTSKHLSDKQKMIPPHTFRKESQQSPVILPTHRTVNVFTNQEGNVPIRVSYEIPDASQPGLQTSIARPAQQEHINTAGNMGMVIRSVVPNLQGNVPISASYKVPNASIARPAQQAPTSGNMGMVISSVVTLKEPEVQANRPILAQIPGTINNVGDVAVASYLGNIPSIQQPPIVRQYPAVNVQQHQMYLERMHSRRNSTHGYNPNMNVPPPPQQNERGSVIVPSPTPPHNINFYNSSTQNSVSAPQEVPNNQTNSHQFVPNNWVYRATLNQVIAAPQMLVQGAGASHLHLSQSNGTQNNPQVQSNQNGFRIRTVGEINKSNQILECQGLPVYNASQPRNHHLQIQSRQYHQPNTPPSPPSTPSLEETMDVTIQRYGEQIQIFTCPKSGNRENLTDILDHIGDSRKLVEKSILHEVFVNGVKQLVLIEREERRSTEQLKNQILQFFSLNYRKNIFFF